MYIYAAVYSEDKCWSTILKISKNNIWNNSNNTRTPGTIYPCNSTDQTFPYAPSMGYVRPRQDMSVNVSEHVDPNGRINLPYLRD